MKFSIKSEGGRITHIRPAHAPVGKNTYFPRVKTIRAAERRRRGPTPENGFVFVVLFFETHAARPPSHATPECDTQKNTGILEKNRPPLRNQHHHAMRTRVVIFINFYEKAMGRGEQQVGPTLLTIRAPARVFTRGLPRLSRGAAARSVRVAAAFGGSFLFILIR